jgi:hypothetical protein
MTTNTACDVDMVAVYRNLDTNERPGVAPPGFFDQRIGNCIAKLIGVSRENELRRVASVYHHSAPVEMMSV